MRSFGGLEIIDSLDSYIQIRLEDFDFVAHCLRVIESLNEVGLGYQTGNLGLHKQVGQNSHDVVCSYLAALHVQSKRVLKNLDSPTHQQQLAPRCPSFRDLNESANCRLPRKMNFRPGSSHISWNTKLFVTKAIELPSLV